MMRVKVWVVVSCLLILWALFDHRPAIKGPAIVIALLILNFCVLFRAAKR